jgi:predicted outer membrane repeat protein
MIGCTFRENTSYHSSGAIITYFGSPRLINCVFRNNQAGDGVAGAMGSAYSDLTLANCVFVGNSAATYGGALFNEECRLITLTNCTFAANTALDGEALACDSGEQPPSTIALANCILWNSGNEIWNGDGSTLTITYSDVRGGWLGEGNIESDPLLAGDGVHIGGESPCRNAGDPMFVPVDVKVDIDGQPRVLEGRVDMGADEWLPLRRRAMAPDPARVD